MRRDHDALDSINYLLLLATIVIGVAAGNLLSNAITAAWVNHRAEQWLQELEAQAKVEEVNLQREARKRKIEFDKMTEDQRRKSTIAQEMLRMCRQWRQAYSDTNTETAKDQAEKFCSAYDRFVKSGRVTDLEYRTNVVPGK